LIIKIRSNARGTEVMEKKKVTSYCFWLNVRSNNIEKRWRRGGRRREVFPESKRQRMEVASSKLENIPCLLLVGNGASEEILRAMVVVFIGELRLLHLVR